MATALGAAIGLLPKLSFFALVLMVLLYRLRANLAAGIASALLFTIVGEVLGAFLHRTGYLVLTWSPLLSIWTWLHDLPLLAWTGFNNTRVAGGLVVGAYLFFPLFLLTHWFCERYRVPLAECLRQQYASLLKWLALYLPGGSKS